MQQGHGLIHSPSSSAKTSKDALTESKSPSPPVQALQKCFPSPSVHRSNSASSFMYRLPHWLRYKRFMNTEGPISVSHSSIWRGFFTREEIFLPLHCSHFISLSFFSLCFCFRSPVVFHLCLIPISHCRSLSRLPLLLHRRSQSFPLLTDLFFSLFGIYCSLMNYSDCR